jgi:hypothetical protein
MARCIANRAEDVSQYLGILFFDLNVKFDLTVGDLYPVLGMELYREFLQLLVTDNSDHQRPQWLPLELFEINISKLPTTWYFVSYPEGHVARERGFKAVWGYRQLVESDVHRQALEELEPNALAVFASERRRIAE